MMKKHIKILFFTAAILAVLCLCALYASAAQTVDSGACGDALTWTLDEDGLLTISGNGPMDEWSPAAPQPWKRNRSAIRNVAIGDGVTSVGSYAFCDCPALETAALPDSVTAIGKYAFSNSGLREITMSAAVETIGACAFSGCSELTSAELPKPLVSLGSRAFYGCAALNELSIGAQNLSDASRLDDVFCGAGTENGFKVIFTDTAERVPAEFFHTFTGDYVRVTDVVLGKNVKTVGARAFQGCRELRTVDAPENGALRTVNAGAFEDCSALETVLLPWSVTRIKENAFAGCVSLKELTVYANKLTAIEMDTFANAGRDAESLTVRFADSVAVIPEGMFYCSVDAPVNITEVQIGSGVTAIGPSAFRDCRNLKELVLADGSNLESIGEYSFMNCTSLTAVTLPENLTKIGREAWFNCTSLTSIVFRCGKIGKISEYAQVFYNAGRGGDGITVTFEAPMTRIPDSLFFSALDSEEEDVSPKIVSVSLNKEIRSIGISSFYGCKELKEVLIPQDSELTVIQDEAFFGCAALTSFYFPEGLEYVYYHAFYDCVRLSELQVDSRDLHHFDSAGDTFANAGIYANKLSVSFGENAEKVPGYMFFCHTSCGALVTEVHLGSGVREIGQHAFENCSYLHDVSFAPDTAVASLGEDAFFGCDRLKALYFYDFDCKMPATAESCGNDALTVIYGYGDSTARTYAEEYGYRFVQIHSSLKGDIDDNGKLSAADARLALRASVGLEKYAAGSRTFTAADADGDGKISAADARLILRAAVKLEDLNAPKAG